MPVPPVVPPVVDPVPVPLVDESVPDVPVPAPDELPEPVAPGDEVVSVELDPVPLAPLLPEPIPLDADGVDELPAELLGEVLLEPEGVLALGEVVVDELDELAGFLSQAVRPIAAITAKGIIKAFMIAPVPGLRNPKMDSWARSFRALIHRCKSPRGSRRFLAVVVYFVCESSCFAVNVSIQTADPLTPQLPAQLLTPEGSGPFPAIVLLHDCSGLGPRSSGTPGRWAQEFLRRGYAVILPDSFAPRGHQSGICTVPQNQRHAGVVPSQRAEDAYAALAYLRTLPVIDGSRIGVMGGSHGGASTLAAMALIKPKEEAFLAAVALYPACASNYGAWRTNLTGVYEAASPVFILIGESDDWTPAENCRKLVASAQQAGHPVTLKVYPGAHHSFDSTSPVRYSAARINPNAPGRRGATTGGQAEAWAASIREVVEFFSRTLQR